MCFCRLIEDLITISQDMLFLQFPQSSADVYRHWCWEFIWNFDVMQLGLTATLPLHYFYFTFKISSHEIHHDMKGVTFNKALRCWGLWKCSLTNTENYWLFYFVLYFTVLSHCCTRARKNALHINMSGIDWFLPTWGVDIIAHTQ